MNPPSSPLRPPRRAVLAIVALAVVPAQRGAWASQLVDRGTFVLFADGQEAGTEEFVVQRSGTGDAQITVARGTVVMRDGRTLATTLRATGPALVVSSYQVVVSGADTLSILLSRAGERMEALTRAPWGEEAREYRAPPSIVVLEDGVAHHYFVLSRLAGREPGRVATLAPLSEAEETSAAVEARSETIELWGGAVETTRISVGTGSDHRVAWFDGSGRLVRVALPTKGFAAERVLRPGPD